VATRREVNGNKGGSSAISVDDASNGGSDHSSAKRIAQNCHPFFGFYCKATSLAEDAAIESRGISEKVLKNALAILNGSG